MRFIDAESSRVRDQATIRKILHRHLLEKDKLPVPWLCEIFSRQHRPGGIIYEGAIVLSALTTDTETTYQIMIDDHSTQLKLSLIEYVTPYTR
jgi:hypothetical protein